MQVGTGTLRLSHLSFIILLDSKIHIIFLFLPNISSIKVFYILCIYSSVLKLFCMLGKFSCFCCLLLFYKMNFFKKLFQEYHQSVNFYCLDQDQAGQFVGPDLGPNCLQMLSVSTSRQF